MNFNIETLNQWGGQFLNFAWPMLWQSSLLIAVVLAIDFLIRRKIRASLRYALWLVVLVKLCLPPTLALPTSPAWWLHKTPPSAAVQLHYTVTYDTRPLAEIPRNLPPVQVAFKPVMTSAAWLLMGSGFVSVLLVIWLLLRWWRIAWQMRRAKDSERLTVILNEVRQLAGVKFSVPVKLTANSMSPAVCGLFHPVILIPPSLAAGFSDEQLRVVLLHELVHLRRRDVWLNFLQALLQAAYWWHPLVWLANARIRRVREEAVDDAVMLALRDKAGSYAPTLLEVARLALNRPLASLGLVGVLESRSALRQRIERLISFRPPRKAGLTLISLLGIAAFIAVAVPMGGAPTETSNQTFSGVNESLNEANSGISAAANPSNRSHAAESPVAITFKINQPIGENDLKKLFLDAGVEIPPTVFFYKDNGILFVRGSREQLALVDRVVLKLNGCSTKEIEADNDRFLKRLSGPATTDENATNLFSRTFKASASVFTDALRNISGLQTNSVSATVRSLFSRLGVDWELPKGKSVFYNDRLGLLFVRATLRDLDTIEQAIQALNDTAPQIHIKARFIELPGPAAADLCLGSFSTASIPASDDNPQPTQNTIKQPEFMVGATGPALFTGIMTESQFQTALRTLESNDDKEMLAEPEVTTLSERQTQMRATQVITVITNFAYRETSTNSEVFPQTNMVEIGPVLDTIATVLPDGYTIDLRTTASLREFLGYDQPTNEIVKSNAAGKKINLPSVLPSFSVRNASAHVRLWDGQTVVLGGVRDISTMRQMGHMSKSGSGLTGERLFRKQTSRTVQKRQLLVLVTVTLVDAAGNRIHSGNEMLFAKDAIPPQSGP